MNAPGIKERFDDPGEQQRSAIENELVNARFAMPGIIVSFDPVKQTASVQPAITENVQIGDSDRKAMNLPVLSDVPVQFPHAGGYCLTFPVKKDDECLLIFGDMCIDGWWQSGGVQDQMEKRRHDLSDAHAILGISSLPRVVAGFSNDSVMLRNEDKSTYIEINDSGDVNVKTEANVNLTAPIINTSGALNHAGPINVTGDVYVSGTITAGEAAIAGIEFSQHIHGGVMGGPGTTEEPQKR